VSHNEEDLRVWLCCCVYVCGYVEYLTAVFFLVASIYSERFVGYFLLSRGGRSRDDCEVVSIRIGYGFRDFTLKHRAS
jgi:hypothetical protein